MTFKQLVRSFPQWSKQIEVCSKRFEVKETTLHDYIGNNYNDIKKAFENKDISLYLSVLKEIVFDDNSEANLEGLLRAGMAYFEYINSLN